MRKSIIFVLIFISSYGSLFPQTNNTAAPCIDTIRQSGFIFQYVTINKKSIARAERREKRLAKKGIHESKIDEGFRHFWFVKGDSSMSEIELSQKFVETYEGSIDSMFTFCPYQGSLGRSICGLDFIDYHRPYCSFPDLHSKHLFQLKTLPGHIYKIYYIDAEWQIVTIPSRHVNVYLTSNFPLEQVVPNEEKIWVLYAINVLYFNENLKFYGKISEFSPKNQASH